MTTKEGDKVKVHYKGTLKDGTVFDQSKEPIEFIIGKKQVIPGFEKAVAEMKKGETKSVTIPKEEAYQDYRPEFVKELPRSSLPADKPIKAGDHVLLRGPKGEEMLAKVVEASEEKVKLDLNHPLAGKDLKFELTLVEVNG